MNFQFTISPFSHTDIDDVVTLYRTVRLSTDKNVYPEYAQATYNDSSFYQQFREKISIAEISRHIFVAKSTNEEIVGFLIMGKPDEEIRNLSNDFTNAAELHQIYICPKHQRLGIGKALLEKCFVQAKLDKNKELFINVLGTPTHENKIALAFYKVMGAERIGHVEERKQRAGQLFHLKCPILRINL